MKKILIISILCCIGQAIYAQYGDFDKALPIANEGRYTIPSMPDAGRNTKEVESSTCLKEINFEKHSAWLLCKVAKGGSIAFDIYPKVIQDDLDFIVYRLPKGTLEQKEEMRCMAAGENNGDPRSSMPCQGVTGLNDFASDRQENQGCSDFKDNFLSSIEAKSGETYAILVNNFSSTEGFTIVFRGTAQLQESENNVAWLSEVTPNPCLDNAKLMLQIPQAETVSLSLYNLSGQLVYQSSQSLSKGLHEILLPVQHLATGNYQLQVKGTAFNYVRSLIKIN